MTCSGQSHSGWLHKRYPVMQGVWQKRWCILKSNHLCYYRDESCKFVSGSVTLQANTALQRFSDELAPSLCPNLFKEHPFGFVLDIDPSFGAHRQLLYFSACHRDSLDAWIWFLLRAICQVAEASKSAALQMNKDHSLLVPCWHLSVCHASAAQDLSLHGASDDEQCHNKAVRALSLEMCESVDGDGKSTNHDTPSTAATSSGSDSRSDQISPFCFDIASDSDHESHREEPAACCDVAVGTDSLSVESTMCCDAAVDTASLHVSTESSMQTDSCCVGSCVDDSASSSNADDTNCEQPQREELCRRTFTSGDPVCLVGLKSECGSKLNGLRGVLIRFEETRQRWQVKLRGSREVKLIRSVNLLRPSTKEHISCLRDSFIPEDDLVSFLGDNTCAICLEEFTGSAVTITRCGHIFHMRCLARARTSTCPQCRQGIDDPSAEAVPEDPAPNRDRELLSTLLLLMAGAAQQEGEV